jgi:hypothetical protein
MADVLFDYDVESAANDGFSSADIADHVAKKSGYDIGSARADGHSDDDIIQYITGKRMPFAPDVNIEGAIGDPEVVAEATSFNQFAEDISRSNYASAGAVSAALDPDASFSSVYEAARKGWTLEERKLFGDVIEESMPYAFTSPTASAVFQTVGGLVGDILLDPLTYVSTVGKHVGKIKKVKHVGQWLSKKLVTELETKETVMAAGKLFSNKVGPGAHKEAHEILSKFEMLKHSRTARSVDDMVALDKQVRKLAKSTGNDVNILRERIVNHVEKGLADENATLNEMVHMISDRNAEQLVRERALGLSTGEIKMSGPDLGVNYFVHAVTKDGKNWLARHGGKEFKGVSRNMSHRHASQLQRKYGGMTVAEVNAEMRIRGFNGDFLITDPVRAQAVRDIRHARATTAAEFYDEMGRVFGVEQQKKVVKKGEGVYNFVDDPTPPKPSQTPLGWVYDWEFKVKGKPVQHWTKKHAHKTDPQRGFSVTVGEGEDLLGKINAQKQDIWAKEGIKSPPPGTPGLVPVKPDRLKGKLFEPEVAAIIDAHHQKFFNPDEVNIFLRHFDNMQNWWKRWTLGVFPAYHMRNMMGNFWNNFLGDVNPLQYRNATYAQRGRAGKLKTVTGDIDYKDAMQLAHERGVMGKGFYGGDIPEAMDDALMRGKWLTLSSENKLVRGGMKVGRAIEENARLAHFFDKLSKGMSPDDAAKSVKKFLFDYTELTTVEQNIFKRLFPFYSWTRKNLPLQAEMWIRKPGKQIMPVKFKHEIERLSADQGPPPEANVGDFLMGDYAIRIGGREQKLDKEGNAIDGSGTFPYVPLGGYLPWGDIPRLVNSPSELLTNMLSPFLKEPGQQIWNYDVFKNKQIINPELPQAYIFPNKDEEMERVLGVELSPRAAHVLKNMRLISTIDRANPFQAFGESRMGKQELDTGKKIAQYIFGIRAYDVDETMSMVYGLYGERRKSKGLEKDLLKVSIELGEAEEGTQQAKDLKRRIDILLKAIERVNTKEVQKHLRR